MNGGVGPPWTGRRRRIDVVAARWWRTSWTARDNERGGSGQGRGHLETKLVWDEFLPVERNDQDQKAMIEQQMC